MPSRASSSPLRLALLLALSLAACAHAPDAPAVSPAPADVAPPPMTSPSPSASPPSSGAAAAELTANDVLAKNRAAFDACFARAAGHERRKTTIGMTFMLDDSSKPMTVDLEYKNKLDETTKQCLKAAALALQFPVSMHGKVSGSIDFAPAP